MPRTPLTNAEGLARKFEILARVLDERTRRLVAAAEAETHGFGGVTAVARAAGLSRGTVIRGLAELKSAPVLAPAPRCGEAGAGRKRTVECDATLARDLDSLIEPVAAGTESPFRWTCKSVRQLAAELCRMGHKTSHRMVAEILHDLQYSLQSNRKTVERVSRWERESQFNTSRERLRNYRPQISPSYGWKSSIRAPPARVARRRFRPAVR